MLAASMISSFYVAPDTPAESEIHLPHRLTLRALLRVIPVRLLEPIADREVLDRLVDRRIHPLDRAGLLEPAHAGRQEREHAFELRPGQVGAHTQMGPEAENQVLVGSTVDAELERVLEHLFVPVP